MRRPNWRSAMFAAASGVVGLSILAGCSTGQYGLSSGDETSRYLQNARGRYVVPGPPGDPWGPYIREASNRFDIPEPWIRALMRQESGGNLYRNGRLITSGAGAMGLMQVMPGTYAELRARHHLGSDPFDPHDNIMAGVGYMREMYDMYGSPGFLAAYNAGPNRLDDYLANQRGLPDETRHYVAAIGPALRSAQPRVHSPAEQYAMNQVPLYIPAGPRFGYGSSQLPTMQLASAAPAAPVYRPAAPTYTTSAAAAYAAATPVYTPAPQPRALAWSEPAKPVYAPAPVAVQAPAPQPPRQVAVARVEDDRDDDTPVRRTHMAAAAHQTANTRLALVMPPAPPLQRSGNGFHLISSAMASESYAVHRPGKSHAEPGHSHEIGWKLHPTGPSQGAPACHKDSHGKTVCTARHI